MQFQFTSNMHTKPQFFNITFWYISSFIIQFQFIPNMHFELHFAETLCFGKFQNSGLTIATQFCSAKLCWVSLSQLAFSLIYKKYFQLSERSYIGSRDDSYILEFPPSQC
jgi:hypothetical protein